MATEKEIVIINNTEITFYPNSHQYRIDGKVIPSVTSILGMIDKSRQLLKWSENLTREFLTSYIGMVLENTMIERAVTQYSQKRDTAGDIGHRVHDWIHNFIKSIMNGTEEPSMDDLQQEVINGVMGFLKWYGEHKVEFLNTEKIVYSKKYNYVGTFDVLMYVDGVLTLGDYKTGKSIYPETKLQLAGYDLALQEELKDLIVKQYLILHFNKDNATFEAVPYKPDKQSFKVFTDILYLKRYLAEVK
jgi:hypothetical protein